MPINGSAYLYLSNTTTTTGYYQTNEYYYSTDSTGNRPGYTIPYTTTTHSGWYVWDETEGYVPYQIKEDKKKVDIGDNEIIRN